MVRPEKKNLGFSGFRDFTIKHRTQRFVVIIILKEVIFIKFLKMYEVLLVYNRHSVNPRNGISKADF